jgi:hypothetical protein
MEAAAAGQVHGRNRVGSARRVVGDPVVVGDGHPWPPGRRGAPDGSHPAPEGGAVKESPCPAFDGTPPTAPGTRLTATLV